MTTHEAVGGESAARSDSAPDRWYLNDQRDFLLRSIEDAEREYEAGDLTKADFDVLVLRDQQRLAEVETELAALGPERTESPEPVSSAADAPTRRRYGPWRRFGVVATSLLIVVGAVVLVNHAVNPSLPGQPITGTVTLSKVKLIAQELSEAAVLNNNGEGVEALELYQKVLTEDPTDPVALSFSGWLEWNYGNAGKRPSVALTGRNEEKKAIELAPSYYAGHLFLGLIVLNQDHDPDGAITQFTKFLADAPPDAELVSVAPQVASAYKQAKVPYPAKLAAAIATATNKTTTTTSTP